MTLEDILITQGQTLFSMGVAGYLLIRTTAELKTISETLKVISEQLEDKK